MTDQKPIGEGVLHADIVLTIIISCYNTAISSQIACGQFTRILPTNPMKSSLSKTARAMGQAKW